jgi:hypothetical protein
MGGSHADGDELGHRSAMLRDDDPVRIDVIQQ